jgi:hypothetical protein
VVPARRRSTPLASNSTSSIESGRTWSRYWRRTEISSARSSSPRDSERSHSTLTLRTGAPSRLRGRSIASAIWKKVSPFAARLARSPPGRRRREGQRAVEANRAPLRAEAMHAAVGRPARAAERRGERDFGRAAAAARFDGEGEGADLRFVAEREDVAGARIERRREGEADRAAAARKDGEDAGAEHVGAVDFGEARIDPLPHPRFIGHARLALVGEHAVDHLAVHVERIAGDHRARRHGEREIAFQDLVAGIGEARGDGGFGDRAVDADLDVQRLDPELAPGRFRRVDPLHAGGERGPAGLRAAAAAGAMNAAARARRGRAATRE